MLYVLHMSDPCSHMASLQAPSEDQSLASNWGWPRALPVVSRQHVFFLLEDRLIWLQAGTVL